MKKKDLKKKIRDEIRADQAAYDERTRRLQAAIDRYRDRLGPAPERRASS